MIIDSESKTMAFAICGAYLMVTFADGHHEAIEEGRLMATLVNDPQLARIATTDLQDAYNDLQTAFLKNYSKAEAATLNAIKNSYNNQDAVDLIIKAARCAIVADRRIEGQEELVMNKIAAALGIDEGTI